VFSACSRCDIEITALVDASAKSRNTDWQNILNLLNAYVGNFNINPTCVRNAIIRYGGSAQVSFGLTQHTSLSSLQQAIRSLSVMGGTSSNLLAALQTVRSQVKCCYDMNSQFYLNTVLFKQFGGILTHLYEWYEIFII